MSFGKPDCVYAPAYSWPLPNSNNVLEEAARSDQSVVAYGSKVPALKVKISLDVSSAKFRQQEGQITIPRWTKSGRPTSKQ
jgi:hypothetical protein